MKQCEVEHNYVRADSWCKGVVKKGHDLLFCGDRYDTEISKAAKDLNFSIDSLSSFLRNMHLTYVKKRSYVIRNQMHSHILVEYCEGASILSLAKKYNFPPSLLARGIVENITIFEKKEVTKAMKDPFVKLSSLENIFGPFRASEDAIQSENAEPLVDPFSGASVKCPIYASRLAREVVEATNSDPLYGPRVEKERNYVGIEYEMILERALSSMNIPFETEEQLRAKGSSRTPDILFSCPVALKVHKKLLSNSRHGAETIMIDEDDSNYVWKMVCWIDSKAMFGDVKTHQTSVLPQAESYVHRFGPGLILYWFGHAPLELLGTGHGDDVFVIGWDIPDVFMMPTGEFARDGHA